MGTKTVQQHHHHLAPDFHLLADQCGGGFPVSFQFKSLSSSSSSVVVVMDRAIEQRSLEAIRATMQKQEEVFKQQVRELHRLYSVQRMLMEELRTHEMERQRVATTYNTNTTTTTTTTTTTNLLMPPTSTSAPSQTNLLGFNIPLVQLHTPSSSSSQTKSSSAEAATRVQPQLPRALQFDLDAQEPNHPIREENRAGPSNRQDMEDNDDGVDLTLSIGGGGGGSRNKRPDHHHSRMTTSLGCTTTSDNNNNKDICTSSSTNPTLDDHDKNPHWPFHGFKM